jgi:hypothetical protein
MIPDYYRIPGGDSGRDLLDVLSAQGPPCWWRLLPPERLPVAYHLAVDVVARAWRAGHPAKNSTPSACVDDYHKIAESALRLAAILEAYVTQPPYAETEENP